MRLTVPTAAALSLSQFLFGCGGREQERPVQVLAAQDLDRMWRTALLPESQQLLVDKELVRKLESFGKHQRPPDAPKDIRSFHPADALSLLSQTENDMLALSKIDRLVRPLTEASLIHPGDNLFNQAYSDLQIILDTPNLRSELSKIYEVKRPGWSPDCSERSAVLLSAAMIRSPQVSPSLKNNTFDLVSGLYLHPQKSPSGTFHQWVEHQGMVYDPSIVKGILCQYPAHSLGYCPIARCRVTLIREDSGSYRVKRDLYLCVKPDGFEVK